ncbi:hypothetical protein SBON0123_002890 [Salmonella bongori serovar 40:z35:- str. 95-0123]|nr:hypothetical protein [Salmonella bongori serovar 40:z35:- str. 95-0123]
MHPGFRQKLTSNTKYPFYSRKVNKIYWRYKHLVTGKSHSLGTNEKKLQLHIVQEKLEAK